MNRISPSEARPTPPDAFRFPAPETDIRALLRHLLHDLGKYLTLVFRFLPEDADRDALNEAVADSLFRTRSLDGGYESAEAIWRRYAEQIGNHPGRNGLSEAALQRLTDTVERALAWRERLPIDPGQRADVAADFFAVPETIHRIMEDLP